jgi:hypothetical protein
LHFHVVNTTAVLVCYMFIACFIEGIQRIVLQSNQDNPTGLQENERPSQS